MLYFIFCFPFIIGLVYLYNYLSATEIVKVHVTVLIHNKNVSQYQTNHLDLVKLITIMIWE